MTTKTNEINHGLQQAKAQLKSVKDMVKALNEARESNNDNAYEEALTRIQEDILSLEVRQDWHTIGQKAEAGEYRLLLCWGGPAVQIVGDLNEYNEPESANIQYQDWFTGWSNLNISQEEENILLDYARVFYFGN
jgi:hypothetical protein